MNVSAKNKKGKPGICFFSEILEVYGGGRRSRRRKHTKCSSAHFIAYLCSNTKAHKSRAISKIFLFVF
jgi:hypothetical protein